MQHYFFPVRSRIAKSRREAQLDFTFLENSQRVRNYQSAGRLNDSNIQSILNFQTIFLNRFEKQLLQVKALLGLKTLLLKY